MLQTELYSSAGAREVWIVYLGSRMGIFNADGQMESSEFSEGIREQIFG